MRRVEENIIFEKSDNCLTVVLKGEIDHHKAKDHHRLIDNMIISERPDILLFDLSNVSFMDSSGLGLILGRYRFTKELGIVFKILSPAPNVMKILKLAGCERIIEIVGKKDA